MGTAYAVLALEFAGRLHALADPQRDAIEAFLRAGCGENGEFVEELPVSADSDAHDEAYRIEETTTFCQQALDALCVPPPPPRRWPGGDVTVDGALDYVQRLPWENPWLDSNRVMFFLSQLCHDSARHGHTDPLRGVDAVLDWLDACLSPETGWWRGPVEAPAVQAMAATAHFSFFYGWRRRPMKHLDALIDSLLRAQSANGLFCGKIAGHTCLDYDAIDLLAKAQISTQHRAGEVQNAMARAAGALGVLQLPDGGFAHARYQEAARGVLEPVDGVYHTGSPHLAAPAAESNVFSTWFRLLALRLTDDNRAIQSGRPWGGVFRRLPFLGYHDALAIQLAQKAPSTHGPVITITVQPTIAVIIPAHNAAHTLGAALTSLQAQGYPHWQAIVVNDGSTDDTGAIASQWATNDGRIHVIHQDNAGLGAARNRALQASDSRLVHCLDADDALPGDFYERMSAALSSTNASSGAGRCAVSGTQMFVSDRILAHMPAPSPERLGFEALATGNPCQPVCFVFERTILDKTGYFDASLPHCHDHDLWLRFARVGVRFVPVPEAVALYRVGASSLSSNLVRYVDTDARVMMRATAPDERCDASQHAPLSLDVVQRGIACMWLTNLRRAVSRLDTQQVDALVGWARKNLPSSFWADPAAFGALPRFENAYDCPLPYGEEFSETFRQIAFHFGVLDACWPELAPVQRKRLVKDALRQLLAMRPATRRSAWEATRWAVAQAAPAGKVLRLFAVAARAG